LFPKTLFERGIQRLISDGWWWYSSSKGKGEDDNDDDNAHDDDDNDDDGKIIIQRVISPVCILPIGTESPGK
jgi:hypothetical protein